MAPKLPINKAITAKILDSAKIATPIGRPMPNTRLITAHCGQSKRLNNSLL